jgi:Flp pilus assembly protein CpaB
VVTADDLLTPLNERPAELVLPFRDVTVPIRAPANPAGFVAPGISVVDVILTREEADRSTSSILLSQRRVMAVDSPEQPDGQGLFTAKVTFRVWPEEVEKLRQAAATGVLHVALCEAGAIDPSRPIP